MGINPFKYIPYKKFFIRSWKYAVGVFVLGLLLIGIVSSSLVQKGGQNWYTIQRAISSTTAEQFRPVESERLWPHEALLLLYSRNLSYVVNFPTLCWTGDTVNDLQKQRCGEFWDQWGAELILAMVPFGLVLLFFVIAQSLIGALYGRAFQAIERKSAQVTGIVTDPAVLPLDFFCWFYCLKPISVQLPNGEQVCVYFPVEAHHPKPGQKVALFAWGDVHGKKRWVGCLYTPSLAVLEAY